MGSSGPIPKRDAERRRRNKPTTPTDTVKMTGKVRVPAADKAWHPVAAAWYRSLKLSGQSKYYEPSDWAMAKFAAQLMSGVLQSEKPSSEMVKALNVTLGSLLCTEGDRRRVRMEIERQAEGGGAELTVMDAYRRARQG